MPRGGHAHSGPAPDPNSIRSASNAADWITLPTGGRTTPAPTWPLPSSTERESTVWADLWSKPQALEWERLGQQHYVAIFVRRLVEAEEHGSPVNISTLVRQMSDELGLTAGGMNRNRWKIERIDDAAAKKTPVQPSARQRLTVVPARGA